ncbi:MAG: hypothetical protein ABR584_03840 [Candidatus Baltobacteraceae bacterium]
MNKLYTAGLATAFATASSLAILVGGAQQPASNHQTFLSSAPTIALADRGGHGHHKSAHNRNTSNDNDNDNDNNNDNSNDNNNNTNHGNNGRGNPHNCVNPAGHQRGWCKHNGNGNGGNQNGGTTLNGTVDSINGNVVTFRLDNGQVVTILDNNGTQLSPNQHYSLRVYSQNGQYVLGNSNGYNNGGNGQYGSDRRTGTIAIVSGNTLTFTNGSTIDISQVNGNTNGSLSTFRSITAYGYVSNGVFYAQYIR